MIGVVGGLAAAVLWGASGFTAARAARTASAEAALGWVYVVGLAATLPLAIALDGAPEAGGRAAGWAAVTVVGAVSSLYFMYAALQRGPAVLVMPLTAAQGGLAAFVAVAAGESLETAAAVAIVVMLVGMYAAMRRPRATERTAHPELALALAAACAVTSAVALFAAPRAAHDLGTLWMLALLRLGGVAGITVPLALSGRLPRPAGIGRFVLFSGLADAAAFGSYIYASERSGVVVPAVLASQYAAVSAILAAVLLGERLTRVQLAGIVAIFAGVAVVTTAQS